MNLLSSPGYLLALHAYRQFGRTAQACNITQPALSNALPALETEFNVVSGRRMRNPTVACWSTERQRCVRCRPVFASNRPLAVLSIGFVAI
ncbi:MAG: LysR family transcriptional regulator [Candidatus Saccharibacteria bacterium]|nr:LysR family transcriptional regulator [Rhodoferax sp.]